MSQTTTRTAVGRQGWATVRHYAYVERPYDDAWAALAAAPHQVLGAGTSEGSGPGISELHVRRAGVHLSRAVTIRFGGMVCEEDMTRMALRWEDARRPELFPVFEGVLSLAPLTVGSHQVTQVGLVGKYRPPFGALGAIADRVAGGEGVAEESVAGFVDDVAVRLATLVDPAAPANEPEGAGPGGLDSDEADRSRVLVPLDGLGARQGGAVGVARQLAGTPGVIRAEIDPLAGMAEIVYDPDQVSLSRVLAELEVDVPPQNPDIHRP